MFVSSLGLETGHQPQTLHEHKYMTLVYFDASTSSCPYRENLRESTALQPTSTLGAFGRNEMCPVIDSEYMYEYMSPMLNASPSRQSDTFIVDEDFPIYPDCLPRSNSSDHSADDLASQFRNTSEYKSCQEPTYYANISTSQIHDPLQTNYSRSHPVSLTPNTACHGPFRCPF